MARIVCVGEAMLELSSQGTACSLGYGGDTLNTAIHLARLGHSVSYLTALGNSPFSNMLKEKWSAEGLNTSLVLTHPTREVGLYAITTDDAGERSFTYWRGQSAAREMFALDAMKPALEQAAESDLLYFSLITLAILPPEHRMTLLELARRVQSRGGKVAFDSNYRPKLWTSVEEAQQASEAAIACADIGLPTMDDERQLWGTSTADAVATRWINHGCAETIVKLGAEGCRLPDGQIVCPPEKLIPIDTSGAGDAFNAGYLYARLSGHAFPKAALVGHELAGWTIMRQGAIPARST
jgi:2-dehydro-3-deoxygluconokinase